MAWTRTSEGKVAGTLNEQNNIPVMTETVALGGGEATRYSSAFSLPAGVGVTIISNTASTDTSASISDWLYVSYDNSTYFKHKLLRDCNYADYTKGIAAGGVAMALLDATFKIRYVDPDFVGVYPYMKVGIVQGGEESSGKTVGLAMMLGTRDRGSFKNKGSL